MNKTWLRFAAAGLGGLLLSVAFPSLSLAWLAWIAPGMILFCALGAQGGLTFRIGFVGGLAHFLSSLYWLIHMPLTWHGLPLAPALAWLALSAYCALYPALWVWLCWRILPDIADVNVFLSTTWMKRAVWAFATGAIWTALEFMRGLFLTGFPWNFVGASQYKMLPLIQIAAFTGIYGVSFLVIWTSVSICAAGLILLRRPKSYSLWSAAGLPLLAVVLAVGYGTTQLVPVPTPARELKVAMVQPSIPQTLIFDPAADMERFQTVLKLSAQALASKPQLLLWPESAVMDLTPEIQEAIGQLVRRYNAWLLFCAATPKPSNGSITEYYNSALLLSPEAKVQSVYNKRRLVIFGEYVPLAHIFPFLKWLTSVGSETAAGETAVDFDMKNPAVKMSALICFEDMFAQEAREHVGADTDFLVNLTNDGWFGHGAEQWQQAASGIFRAVENGVPILRCTNDGLTCWADAQGRIRQIQGAPDNVYGPGFMVAQVPLRAPDDHRRTFYNLHGDWFSFGCSGIAFGCLAGALRRKSGPLQSISQDTVQK